LGLDSPIVEVSSLHQSHHIRQDSAGRGDRPVAGNSLPDNTEYSLETDIKHPCTRRDSNLQSQQASGRRSMP